MAPTKEQLNELKTEIDTAFAINRKYAIEGVIRKIEMYWPEADAPPVWMLMRRHLLAVVDELKGVAVTQALAFLTNNLKEE